MPFGVQLQYLFVRSFALPGRLGLQVRGFAALALECEVEQAALFYDAAKLNHTCTKSQTAAALFYLLKVAQARVALAFADSEGAVGKVHEHFAALQVVAGDGPGGVALGRMCQHQYRKPPVVFDVVEAAHEFYGGGGAFCTAAQGGNVIDDNGARAGADDDILEGVDEVIVIAGKLALAAGGGVDDNAVKIWRKAMHFAVGPGIAFGKLRGAQLEIEIQHRLGLLLRLHIAQALAATDGIAQLHRQDGFSYIGIGKKDAQFAFKPQIAKKHIACSGFAGREV